MKKQILYMLCATALLSSCHIYKSYDRPEDITASGLYRDPAADNDTLASDTTNFGRLASIWKSILRGTSITPAIAVESVAAASVVATLSAEAVMKSFRLK